ncbi:hypothetical protein RB195_010110 [Necator americanus]|uniref:Bromo domain-containing protein n=1 Tax=Necator americanus TaxID=51031 RepID=A0ABR1CWG6_NECAM
MWKVLQRIILDRLIEHREETTCNDKLAFILADLRLTRCSSSSVEIWQRPSQRAPRRWSTGKFVRLLDDMNQRTTAAVRTPAGCTTPFEYAKNSRPVSYRYLSSIIRTPLDRSRETDVDLFKTSKRNRGGRTTDRTRR